MDEALDVAMPPVPTSAHPWVAQWRDQIGFGVSIFPHPPDWKGFIRLVQRMEEMGIDSYWSYDHPAANADCWTALAALAVSTERIRLGTMVDCIYYRSAYLLARQAADVDRAPNVIRLAPTPLSTTYHELWLTVQALQEIIERDEHLQVAAGRDLVA